MTPETFAHLKEHDYARGDEQADRDKLALAILELLKQQASIEQSDQIQGQAMIVPEIRYAILGQASQEVEHELDGIVAPLTGPTGQVQNALDSGMVLCSAPVARRLSNNGQGEIVIKRPGRFVTGNADLIDEYYLQPAQARLVGTAKRYKGRFELSIERRPELAARYHDQIGKAYQQLELELPRAR